MATRKKTKTTTIQTTVDAYASAQDRSIKLRAALNKAIEAKQAAGSDLVAHVKKTTPGGKVAFHAANGDTLVVGPNSGWGGLIIDTVKPGAQKLPEAPKPATAAIADDVVKALLDGKADLAQKIIAEASNGVPVPGNTVEVALHGQRPAGVIIDDVMTADYETFAAYAAAWRSMYPRISRFWRPVIEQQTYKSATMGPIKLSRRGKDLLVGNREAIQRAVGKSDYNANGMEVSKSRGMIAQYISELEGRVNSLSSELAAQRYRKG